MKGITQISYRQDTHQHHSCKWSVMLPSRSATENVKTREPWFLFDKVSLPKWHWISWNYRKWNNLGWIHVASVTAWTQMYKHAHTVEKEGANLPSTLIIHHMITSHPKHACDHKDPSGPGLAGLTDNCIIVLLCGFLFICHGILFTNCPNLMNYSNMHESLWPYVHM